MLDSNVPVALGASAETEPSSPNPRTRPSVSSMRLAVAGHAPESAVHDVSGGGAGGAAGSEPAGSASESRVSAAALERASSPRGTLVEVFALQATTRAARPPSAENFE